MAFRLLLSSSKSCFSIRLVFAFANNLPLFDDDQNNMFKVSAKKNLISRFVSSTVWFKLLNLFSPCFDHLKKVLREKLPLN